MSNNLIKICYQGHNGSSDIRTFYEGDILHTSLRDVLYTLNRENREIDPSHIAKSMATIIKAQLTALDPEEYVSLPSSNPHFKDETEIFVTQPGLYRVLSSDRSNAGKRFQKWLYHEVIPAITKYGVYPAPLNTKGSLLSQMAEMLAHNSRVLADTIIRQETLEQDVDLVKSRLAMLEANKSSSSHLKTVADFLTENDIHINEEQRSLMYPWCENLTFAQCREKENGTSGCREDIKYTLQTLQEALNYTKQLNIN